VAGYANGCISWPGGRIMPQTRLTESAATVWHEQTSLFLGAERNYQGIRIE